MHQAHLAGHAGQVAEEGALALLEGAHDLEALDGGVGGPQRLKAQSWTYEAFQLAVISLNDVGEVLGLAVLRVLRQAALLFQGGNGGDVTSCGLVGVDHHRPIAGLQTPQRLAQEALGRLGVSGWREMEVDGVAALVYAR